LRAVGDRGGEASTLNNIGSVYSGLGEQQKALGYYEHALPLQRAVGNRSGEAATLNNIGNVYIDLAEQQKALGYYEQALPLLRAVGNRAGEATTLTNMSHLYRRETPRLAISFANQSVNIVQTLRQDVAGLTGEVGKVTTGQWNRIIAGLRTF
jgi:tetratricopeptide (TPR) repeat protein